VSVNKNGDDDIEVSVDIPFDGDFVLSAQSSTNCDNIDLNFFNSNGDQIASDDDDDSIISATLATGVYDLIVSGDDDDCSLVLSLECTTTTTTSTEIPTSEPTTTLAPSPAPVFAECASDDALNIAFVMDESGSVSSAQWDLMKTFVDRIATYDVAGPSFVSVFKYASLPAYTQFLDWTSVETGRDDITAALDNNGYSDGGLTGTWDAMNRVLDELYDYRQICTDGCDTRKDMIFLLTDGQPTVRATNDAYNDVCPDMIPRVNSSNVDIVVIGVGDVSAFINDVACLDLRDDETEVFVVEDFNATQFIDIEEKIRAKTCSGLFPAGPSIRNFTQWVYANGNTSLGPVPDVDPNGDGAPDDQGGSNPISALLAGPSATDKKGLSRSQRASLLNVSTLFNLDAFDLMNLWVMALLLVAVNVALCLSCFCARKCAGKRGKADFDDGTDVEEPDEMDF
jgi:hypothetical protein